MKVKDLEEGNLYKIKSMARLLVIVTQDRKERWLEIHALPNIYHVRKRIDTDELKKQPALYCGAERIKANYYKQGWFKAHRFLIGNEYYLIHGSYIKHIKELK